MKLFYLGVVGAIFIAQTVVADTKSDVLAMTDNMATTTVWVRWPWCNADGTVNLANKADVFLYNEQEHNKTQLMTWSTDNPQYKFVDSAIGYHAYPKLTRKNGNYVIWNDLGNKCSWIRDVACTQPKRKLIDGGDFFVGACQYNPVTDSEYIYLVTGYGGTWARKYFFDLRAGTGIARVPLNSTNYTADMTKKKQLFTAPDTINDIESNNDTGWVQRSIGVSQDGKYVGMVMAIPRCNILDVATGKLIKRQDTQCPSSMNCENGCHTNIAPDNSYRFFHWNDNHFQLAMFDWNGGAPSTKASFYTDIVSGLPTGTWPSGFEKGGMAPLWSNNARFFTVGCPLEKGLDVYTNGNPTAANAPAAGSFFFGKFSADFKTMEKAVRISDGLVTHREVVGDAWIKPLNVSVLPLGKRSNLQEMSGLSFIPTKNGFTVSKNASVRFSDALGNTIRLLKVNAGTYDLPALGNGTYFASVKSNDGEITRKFIIGK